MRQLHPLTILKTRDWADFVEVLLRLRALESDPKISVGLRKFGKAIGLDIEPEWIRGIYKSQLQPESNNQASFQLKALLTNLPELC